SRDAKRDAATAAADEAARRADATWAELAMRVKTAYARYRQAHESLAQTRALLDLVDRLERVAHARYAGGLAAQQDAIRAQVERTSMLSDLAMLESELQSARARLNGLLVRPTDAPLAEPRDEGALPTLARLDAATLRDRVLARNPQLAAEDARIRAAERSRDAVFANRYPEFTLGVAPVQTRNRIGEWELMFEINIPLQQKTRRSEEAEAAAMLAAAQARREAIATETLAALGENLAALEAARAGTAQAATARSFAELRAPIDGVVSQRLMQVGELATPGRPVLTLHDPATLRAVGSLPQFVLPRAAAVRKASVELSAARRIVAAKQFTVLPAADPRLLATPIRAELPPDLPPGVVPGTAAKIRVPLGTAQKLVIPADALVRRGELTGVYVIAADGAVQLRQVRVGPTFEGGVVEVLAGLSAGERVQINPLVAAQ
ncbi:MAG: efflux RND transporter periplasmic adaptor subunit, partial [Burkholderiaceae bacterium]